MTYYYYCGHSNEFKLFSSTCPPCCFYRLIGDLPSLLSKLRVAANRLPPSECVREACSQAKLRGTVDFGFQLHLHCDLLKRKKTCRRSLHNLSHVQGLFPLISICALRKTCSQQQQQQQHACNNNKTPGPGCSKSG